MERARDGEFDGGGDVGRVGVEESRREFAWSCDVVSVEITGDGD